MRQCEGCKCEDAPFYDYRKPCTCKALSYQHGIDKHAPDCHRVRHSVTSYLVMQRRIRKTDSLVDGLLNAPIVGTDEFARLRKNGFRIRAINGELFAERLLCMPCVQKWVEREENREHFERAKRGNSQQSYYQVLCQ